MYIGQIDFFRGKMGGWGLSRGEYRWFGVGGKNFY